jgi:hypothetical protein
MKKASLILFTALAVFFAPAVNAYDTQLTAQAIHEAYVLGQRNDKSTGDFLAPYLSQITEPQNGPHIAEIELLTPYAQIVDDSRRNVDAHFSEQQATDNYHKQAPSVRINVTIMLPAAYPKSAQGQSTQTPPPATGSEKQAILPENFWQSFKVHLKQNDKDIPSRSVSNQPIRSTATNQAPSVLDGENVWLAFDVKDVASVATTVEVVTPEGKSIKALFDLKKLR